MNVHANLGEAPEPPRPINGNRTSGNAGKALVPVAKPRLDKLDWEFLPAALEILNSPPSPVRFAMIWMICAMFAAALAWSYFGWVDIHAVASGKLQPSGRSKLLQPLEAGKVVAVYVENGAHVNAGDILVELDPTETTADRETLTRELRSLDAEITRRLAAIRHLRDKQPVAPLAVDDRELREREEAVMVSDLRQLSATQDTLRSQIAERKAQKNRLTMGITARQRLITALQERVNMRDTLMNKGAGSKAAVIDALQEKEREATSLATDQGQLLEADANMHTLESRLEEAAAGFLADYTQKLADAQRKRDHTVQELVKAQSKSERTRLRAPIAGVVQQLSITTIGQVVSGGQQLMTIVPLDAPLEIEAMVLNSDIGFVEAGQRAAVKIEAFPFTRYGTLEATVTKVSRDAVDVKADDKTATTANATGGATVKPSAGQTLIFPATLKPKTQNIAVDGKVVPLTAGMAVTVEIKTGERRIIDYLLSPLREVTSTAGHER
jgi:hemolysin D